MSSSSTSSSELFQSIQQNLQSENYAQAIQVIEDALPSISEENQKNTLRAALSSLYLTNNQPKKSLEYSTGEGAGNVYNRIYALYRLNQSEEALQLLEKQGDVASQRAFQLLKAQILYKIGDYQSTVQIYKNLIESAPEEANDELYTNYSAALFLSKRYDECVDAATKQYADNTYELSYNAACAAIGKNDFEMAQRYLDFAAKLCRESLEEDGYTEDEIQDELTSILVQTAFVKQVHGENEEAAQLYHKVIDQKPSDAVSLAVAGNNLVSLEFANGDANVVDIEKKMKLATTSRVEGKLTTWQQRGINLNQTLLLIKKKKFDECRALLEKVQKQYPESDVPSIISAAISFKERNYDAAISALQQYIDQQKSGAEDESILRVQLSLAQLQISRGNFQEAASLLEKTSVKNHPGVVGALVALYQKTKRVDDAIRVLDEGIAYWKKQKSANAENAEQNLIALLNASAEFKIRNDKLNDAMQTYRTMVELDPENKKYVAGLVRALATVDLDKAEQYATQLPELRTGDIDVERLEKESVRGLSDTTSNLDTNTTTTTAATTVTASRKNKRRRKKKKNPLPKNYDANKKPDPERWVPKKERAAYKKIHGEGRAHQGSASAERSTTLQAKKGQKKLLKPSDIGKKQRKR